MRVILGSSSPARLATLRNAGIAAQVVIPEVDESVVTGRSGADVTARLAALKGQTVLLKLRADGELAEASVDDPIIVLACDTMLEIEGRVHGKPGTTAAVIERWRHQRGRQGQLFTGHYVALISGSDEIRSDVRVAETVVTFADINDAEIAAYAASGEPQRVAGGFTIDAVGGAFITRIEGDPHNVVGISLPMIRQMIVDMGIAWPRLWAQSTEVSGA